MSRPSTFVLLGLVAVSFVLLKELSRRTGVALPGEDPAPMQAARDSRFDVAEDDMPDPAPSTEGAAVTPSEEDPERRGATSEAHLPTFRIIDLTPVGDSGIPREIQHERTGLRLVYVPAGTFLLGSSDGEPWRDFDERYEKDVVLSGFYVSRTEVYWEAWEAGGGRGGSAAGSLHPVVGVSWREAASWSRDNGLALPTEAQWEYAASGPENRVFPWGGLFKPGLCNGRLQSPLDPWSGTAPVGSFSSDVSWCGVLDLAGNVMEWCRDGWRSGFASIGAHAVDPFRQGERAKVVRGASYWSQRESSFRTAYRDGVEPFIKGSNLGFRVVLEP